MGQTQEKMPFVLWADDDCSVKLADYGPDLARNKLEPWQILGRLNVHGETKRLIIAVAMQETTHLRVDQRDASKDGTASANVSLLNINIDMIQMLGYRGKDNGAALNSQENLPVAVAYAVRAVNRWSAKIFLDFHRGGRTGLADGKSYDCQGYRNAIASIMPLLRKDMLLAKGNSLRCEVDVKHV